MPVRNLRRLAIPAALAMMAALGCDGDPTNLAKIGVGAIQATIVTTGAEPDPDGYRLVVDGDLTFAISTNGSATLQNLDARIHTLRLDDVAPNCQVAGSNPRNVAVPRVRAAAVTFTITCIQFTGSIRVTTTTTGAESDPNGYAVVLDQDPYYPSEGEPISRDGTVTFTRVPGGAHTVSLEDLARNCTVVGSNPRPTTVTPGSETHVAFVVQCERRGGLRLITTTSGTDLDVNGYSAAIGTTRFDTAASLLSNGAFTVVLPPGDVTVTLSGLSTNCNVIGTRERTGVIASGDTVEVRFDVSCIAAPQLAFVSSRDGNAEIYVIKASGADLERRTANTTGDWSPAWSPDGNRIAFQAERDGNPEIYVMNADGSNPVRLTNHPEGDGGPTWSPDGARIAFASHRNGNSDIYVMNADGSNVVRLTTHDGADFEPAWSPDGQRIAFMSFHNGTNDIYVMNTDGSGLTALTSGASDDWSPAWSPDGASIVFSRATDCYYYCEYDLFVMKADGSNVTRLPVPSCDEYDPAWSPDGSRIAFTSAQSYYGVGCPTSVMVMRADGTDVTLVTNGDAWAPAWRPSVP